MKVQPLQIKELHTERLTLIPFTKQICKNLIANNFSDLDNLGLKKGKSWPDIDVLETLPKIINNLSLVEAPTGFESWMIIKNETLEIIGDLGFKGFNYQQKNIDIGYGIIKEERGKGFAEEAARELINWAFKNNMVKEITASCLMDNENSIKLLKKLNFDLAGKNKDMFYWSLKNINTDS